MDALTFVPCSRARGGDCKPCGPSPCAAMPGRHDDALIRLM
jgi:hypothetical protein